MSQPSKLKKRQRRKLEAERLLRDGLYLSQIAERMNVTPRTVTQYLLLGVGERRLRLSDLYFSWPADKRETMQGYEEAGSSTERPDRGLQSEGLTTGDFELFKALRTRSTFYGDMYEYVSATELRIHSLVRRILEEHFGSHVREWWLNGVPENIRVSCVELREKDKLRFDAFCYMCLIDLSTIIKHNRNLFKDHLPASHRDNKKLFDREFRRLNRVRNMVMHPIKNRQWSEDKFEFVRDFARAYDAV